MTKDNLSKIKKIIEKNPVVLATVLDKKFPNAVVVAFVKVISDKEILITDNYLNQTIKDLKQNNNVCLLVWNNKWEGYKIIGRAEYYRTGKWKRFVEMMKENKDLPAKGAILIKTEKIIKLS
jgi:predicted pyridoxine 5'-phosphate oxidase superfamily flavin-nucleotide-binding protein